MTRIVYELTSPSWWKAAGSRALRTAVAVLIPFLAASTLTEIDWRLVLSTVGLSVIASGLTSLVGLKELTGEGVPKLVAIGIRAIKTFAQTFLSYIGAAVLLSEVDWSANLLFALSATVVTIAQGFLVGVPEQEEPFEEVYEEEVLVEDDGAVG